MRLMVLLALAGLVFAAPVATSASAAVAPVAPQYSSSDPADGDTMHQAPDQVTVTFSEPLDSSSEMIVEDHCGNKLDDGNVEVSLNEMSVGIAKKPAGHYMVTYAADGVGGITGSTQGRFSFKVHAGESLCGDSGNGGHGGHGGSGSTTGGTHKGHGGSEGHDQGNGHSGHSKGGHSAGGNQTTGGSEHTAHESGAGGSHMEHDAAAGSEAGHGEHADMKGGSSERDDQDLTGLAAGETPMPELNPDSTAVLLALLLCAAFGALGGWVLRISARS